MTGRESFSSMESDGSISTVASSISTATHRSSTPLSFISLVGKSTRRLPYYIEHKIAGLRKKGKCAAEISSSSQLTNGEKELINNSNNDEWQEDGEENGSIFFVDSPKPLQNRNSTHHDERTEKADITSASTCDSELTVENTLSTERLAKVLSEVQDPRKRLFIAARNPQTTDDFVNAELEFDAVTRLQKQPQGFWKQQFGDTRDLIDRLETLEVPKEDVKKIQRTLTDIKRHEFSSVRTAEAQLNARDKWLKRNGNLAHSHKLPTQSNKPQVIFFRRKRRMDCHVSIRDNNPFLKLDTEYIPRWLRKLNAVLPDNMAFWAGF